MSKLRQLQKKIAEEITAERMREIEEFDSARRHDQEVAEKRLAEATRELSQAGLPLDAVHALDKRLSAQLEKENKAAQQRLDKASAQGLEERSELEFEQIALPKGVHQLTPAWSATFSTQSDDESMGTSEAESQLAAGLVLSGGCKNYFNWARGAGSGLFGTGAATNQAWVEFGFWFRPSRTGYHSIRPLFRFRGYTIVRADDGFWTSKYANTRLTCWTRVHQYNWKPWSSVTALSVGGSNINRTRRFDNDRHTNYSALLGRGDWAYIRCVIGLKAYARGSGSFTRNDFSTGAANYLCVPHVHVD